MSAPLSNGQKAHLAQLATRAFNLERAKARGRGETLDLGHWTLDTWRHAQVARATGKNGLRCCDQNDYKLVEAHFLELLGEHGRAFNAQVRAATEERRVIEYKLVQECQAQGFHLSYADKICRAQNKGKGIEEIDGSSPEGLKRLWNVFYTIRNRGLARARKEKETAAI